VDFLFIDDAYQRRPSRQGMGPLLAVGGLYVPEDIRVETLNDYQVGELNRLKAWLYHQRVKVRQERDRADRKLEREEAEAQRKAEQPGLFEF